VAVARDRAWEEAEPSFRRLAGLAPDRAAAAAVRRAAADEEHREVLVRYVANLGGAGELDAARAWAKDADATVRFFGAWILVRHGERSRREGVDEVLALLRDADGWRRRDAVLDDLLATGDGAALAYVEAAADPTKPEGSHPSLFLLQRRALAGDATALDRVVAALEGQGLPILEETPGDAETAGAAWFDADVRTPDAVARRVADWVPDDVDVAPGTRLAPWPRGDDPESRAKSAGITAAFAAWLREQAALLRAGKATAIQRTPAPRLWGSWGWISSGWVRRM
jgi:hypothetical protein